MWRTTINSWNRDYPDRRRYRVVLSKPGPRGGKRPPIVDVDVYADDQEVAVRRVMRYMNRRLRVEVSDA